MIVTLIASLSLIQDPAPYRSAVEDYFPTKPGTKWTYEQSVGKYSSIYVDEVLPPTDIQGKPAITIGTHDEDGVIQRRYYSIVGNTVNLLGYDPKKPLKDPHPILKFDTNKSEWQFSGLTPFLNDPVPIRMKGTCVSKGRKNVLGDQLDCIEVVLDADIEGVPGKVLKMKQIAIYAKGVGLVEMDSEEKIGNNVKKFKAKLIRFETPKVALP